MDHFPLDRGAKSAYLPLSMDAKTRGLRPVLERNRLRQTDVAEAVGVSRVAVWLWINGRSAPAEANLLRLLAYLRRFEPGLTAEDLLGGALPDDGGPRSASH